MLDISIFCFYYNFNVGKIGLLDRAALAEWKQTSTSFLPLIKLTLWMCFPPWPFWTHLENKQVVFYFDVKF